MTTRVAFKMDDAADGRFGIPLLRARSCVISEKIVFPALIASERRHAIGQPDRIPPHPWRYEVFALPATSPREGWASWDSQSADPLLRAEAERQSTWLAVSLALFEQLESGRLEGFGRRNDIGGEWIAIPPEAWRVLRVPFEYTFGNWRKGYAIGAGLILWGIRIRDRTGLDLHAAAVAYGPTDQAALVQKMRAFHSHGLEAIDRERPSGTSPLGGRTTLSERMAEVPAVTAQDETKLPSAAAIGAARTTLHRSLRNKLVSGDLRGFGRRSDGSAVAFSRSEWTAAEVDFSKSEVRLPNGKLYTNVTVRPAPLGLGSAPPKREETRWRQDDVRLWFVARRDDNAVGRWPFSEKVDHEAAEIAFPGISRGLIRDLRKELVSSRITAGRR